MPNFMLVSLNARFLLKIDLICLAIGTDLQLFDNSIFQANKYGLTCHTNTERCIHTDVFVVLCFEVYFERQIS